MLKKTGWLFLDFHRFPAAIKHPVTTTGHNEFIAAFFADISFSNLIRHFFKLPPFLSDLTLTRHLYKPGS